MSVDPHIITPQTTPAGIMDLSRRVSALEAAGSVISPGAITGGGTGMIAAGAITTPEIAAGAITAGTIAAGAISAYLLTGNTISTGTTGARVVISSTGILAYDAGNNLKVDIDATTGLITATGILTAQPGSSVPWQTPNFVIGGGNIMSNASFEDPTSTTQILYASTGVTVTAGTFTLTVPVFTDPLGVAHLAFTTPALNWNATAAQVQTQLQLSPLGTAVTCTGGPLPGTPITIAIDAATFGVAPPVITVTSSATGGTIINGVLPAGQLTTAGGVTDSIALSTSYHGGRVLRLTGQSAAQIIYAQGFVGPFAVQPNTTYTLSAYFKSATTGRVPTVQLYVTDSVGVAIRSAQSVGAVTNAGAWTRVWTTMTTPVAAQAQLLSISGAPTGGTFGLTMNGQSVTGLSPTASTAAIKTALQSLSSVGATGVSQVLGSLPSEMWIIFSSTVATTPTTMTFSNALTGGTSPTPVIANDTAQFLSPQVILTGANAGEAHYVDAVQLEIGDVPTAFAPRPDEILANSITANSILVSQLSAITANLGNINAGNITGVNIMASTITGTTIIGGTIETAATHPHVVMSSFINAVQGTTAAGVLAFQLDANGLKLPESAGQLSFLDTSSVPIGGVTVVTVTGRKLLQISTTDPVSGHVSLIDISQDTTGSTPANSVAALFINPQTRTILNGSGQSDFVQVGSSPGTGNYQVWGAVSVAVSVPANGYATATVPLPFNPSARITALAAMPVGNLSMANVTWSVASVGTTSISINLFNSATITAATGTMVFGVTTYT